MENPWKDWPQYFKEAVEFLKKEVATPPSVLVVLSGGLQRLVDALDGVKRLSATDIPHFPCSTAEGHTGEIAFGQYQQVPVAVMLGRTHYYEGLPMQVITFPVHVLHMFGAKTLLITNAAGGINPTFTPGDLMMIRDHINLMGDNPLRGVSTQTKYQFVDMTNAYQTSLQQQMQDVARAQDLNMKEGVYLATPGPSYETPAEIRAFRHMGADAVGMSTVPEVIVANSHRMHVAGISCIANMAADLHPGSMNHAEVLKAVQGAEPKLVQLLLGLIERIGKSGTKGHHVPTRAA